MARKDSFDSDRFGKYFSFELEETVRSQGLFVLLSGLVPLIFFIISVIFSLLYDHENLEDFWSGYFIFKILIATVAFVLFFLVFPIVRYGNLTDRREGVMPVLLPASHTEKFFCSVLVSVIIAPVVFLTLYLGSDAVLSALFPLSGKSLAGYFLEYKLVSYNEEFGFSLAGTYAFFLPPMVSFAGLAGGALFKKNKITKTFFSCAVAFILFFMVVISIVDSLYMSAEQIAAMVVRNCTWFWYTVQAVTAAGFGVYYWNRTRTIEL